jgi:uncharacterized membrane protein
MKIRRLRTLTKSLGWECVSFLLTLTVSYLVVDSIAKATELTVILFVVKVFWLYLYERMWGRIRWGLINGDV